jgi:hypothetical protein
VVDVSDRAAVAGRQLREELARRQLSPDVARLYSQHVRLSAGQEGLRAFRDVDARRRLSDAIRLVDAAFYARDRGESDWRTSLTRAAELLEWLAHPELNHERLPLSLLGAACYQLADYPARAASLTARSTDEKDVPLLRWLLANDFEALLGGAVRASTTRTASQDETTTLRHAVSRELASALGVIAAEFRWGGGRRLSAALAKLDAVADVLMSFADEYEWLLTKLASEAARSAVASSLRAPISVLAGEADGPGAGVYERYVRLAYTNKQMIVWPSQTRGLTRLAQGGLLCTLHAYGFGKDASRRGGSA